MLRFTNNTLSIRSRQSILKQTILTALKDIGYRSLSPIKTIIEESIISESHKKNKILFVIITKKV